MARQFVMVCIESSFGSAKAAPVLGTDKFYLRLSQGDAAFKGDMFPQADAIAYGGGYVADAEEVADVALCQGSLATILYPGVTSQILLNWAMTLINSGRSTPWTTTDAGGVMPVGDLASLSFYRAFLNPDGTTYTRERFSGCKCLKWSLSFTEDPRNRKLVFAADWVGIRQETNSYESSPPTAPNSTVFPAPAETDYPSSPWLFSHLARNTGTVKIGSARAQFKDVGIACENVISAKTFESQVIQLARFFGRKATAKVGLRAKPSPDDLASYHSRALLDSEIILDNGTNTLKIDLFARNRIASRERQFPDGEDYAADVNLATFWDPAAANDVAVALT